MIEQMFENGAGTEEVEMAQGRVAQAPIGAGNAMAQQLVRRARLELESADASSDPQMRFLHAHMAAIRAASAVLVISGPVARHRRRVLSVWEQLAEAGESWGAWAAMFAAGAPVRAAIEAGRASDLDDGTADAAASAVASFLEDVSAALAGGEAVAAPLLAS